MNKNNLAVIVGGTGAIGNAVADQFNQIGFSEIIKFGSSLRGRLTTLRSNLFVNIPNWVKNGAW